MFEGKDGSIYIHINRESGKPWITPSISPHEMGMKLDFKNTETPEFEPHKISFHPSGYIHITNKNGCRYRDGMRGPTLRKWIAFIFSA
ncbi:MAG: hypothetical protein IPP22_08610 [Nitrosomonas sp.]|nr:hypothetical protein [Nitrosomonas sp.]